MLPLTLHSPDRTSDGTCPGLHDLVLIYSNVVGDWGNQARPGNRNGRKECVVNVFLTIRAGAGEGSLNV